METDRANLVIIGGGAAGLAAAIFAAEAAAGQRIVLGPVLHLWSTRGTSLGDDDQRSYGGLLRAARTFTPLVTALSCRKRRLLATANSRASVVLPVPGGP